MEQAAHQLLNDIGVAIVAAALLALVAFFARQPIILAYIGAGLLIGPQVGLGLVHDLGSIRQLSEIGLLLLLFIIGLEMDLEHFTRSGRLLLLVGGLQFPVNVALSALAIRALGLQGSGPYDLLYASVGLALASTMIVVKLLYDNAELGTRAGQLSLGILVFQDIWAILFLAVQPSLESPSVATLALALARGGGLVAAALAICRFVLPWVFAKVARTPELLLAIAIAWCFAVAGAASSLGLSKEMGALVAGLGMSAFPYHSDVIAKTANIRDFFVLLFFVSLGMLIPSPDAAVLMDAAALTLVLAVTRFLSIFPIAYGVSKELRVSILPGVNLAQISEFSLVIAAIGLALGHVSERTVALLTFVFVITSVSSTYVIGANDSIQRAFASALRRLGLGKGDRAGGDAAHGDETASLVLLGFFRDASSLLHEFEVRRSPGRDGPLVSETLVADINPEAIAELKRRGVRTVYGDVSSLESLRHIRVESPRVVACTLTGSILRGTTSERLVANVRSRWPGALVVVSADTFGEALRLYEAGADFVYLPRLHSAPQLAEVLEGAVSAGLVEIRESAIADLRVRREVLG